jgi:predicted dithiol-disulfide oxidoreductase (DUF899 family)
MTLPEITTPEAWNAAHKAFLVKEKELTRVRDRLNTERRNLTVLGRQEDWEEPKGRSDDVRSATPNFAS